MSELAKVSGDLIKFFLIILVKSRKVGGGER